MWRIVRELKAYVSRLPGSIQIPFKPITTKWFSYSIQSIMHPYLVLSSHGYVDLFTNGLKTNIPRRVEKLKNQISWSIVKNVLYFVVGNHIFWQAFSDSNKRLMWSLFRESYLRRSFFSPLIIRPFSSISSKCMHRLSNKIDLPK